MAEDNPNNQNKISSEFARRLTHLDPQEKIRVIVLLQVGDSENRSGRRLSRAERQAAMSSVRESAKQALGNIEGIIKDFDGQPLVEHPDVLGSIPIEITAAGVSALATSDAVKAILEDQPIYPEHLSFSLQSSS